MPQRLPSHDISGLRRAPLVACLLAACGLGAGVDAVAAVTRPVGRCGDMAGKGGDTLRIAMNKATAGDIIDLSTLPTTCSTITLTGGEIPIGVPDVTVQATAAHPITIDAGNSSRVFHHIGGGTATFEYLQMINGNGHGTTDPVQDGAGGCIRSVTSVLIEHSSVRNCQAALGGAIYTMSDTLLVQSTVSSNYSHISVGAVCALGNIVTLYGSVSYNGAHLKMGAMYAFGTINSFRTVITGNTAQHSYGPRACTAVTAKGAITLTDSTVAYNSSPGPDSATVCASQLLTLAGTTISANTGEGIYGHGGISISNSTISGNTSSGIHSYGSALSLYSSTIAFNTGRGVYCDICNLAAQSTIIARNGAGFDNPDLFRYGFGGSTRPSANNLIMGTNAAPATDTLHVDPQLSPLSANGGPTKTHALAPTSPAIDAGNNVAARDHDQRGVGYARLGGNAPDIGAFEAQDASDRIFANGFD